MGVKKGLYEPQFWETNSGRGHWTRLFDDLLDSAAFIHLSPPAKALYIYLKREYKGPFKDTKDTVVLPYAQATKNVGIGRAKMNVCLYELEQFGFIKITTSGGLYRIPNQYTFLPAWKNINDKEAKAIKKSKEYGKKYRLGTAGLPTG